MKCLRTEREVKFPCSRVCRLFGDCTVAFEKAQKIDIPTDTAQKFRLIDEYLAGGNIDHRWEAMILEYRDMLLKRENQRKDE